LVDPGPTGTPSDAHCPRKLEEILCRQKRFAGRMLTVTLTNDLDGTVYT
jgi:hypothetical protein